jgi:cytochrome c biogenesis protein ResB
MLTVHVRASVRVRRIQRDVWMSMPPNPTDGTSQPASAKTSASPAVVLYELFSSPGFALFVIIALAVASILGILIIDQVPFRGEMARMRYGDQPGNLLTWLLVHVVPEHPFRCDFYRLLLALLSLSLLACVIKRWRQRWRQALTHPKPAAAAFGGPAALAWVTEREPSAGSLRSFLRRRVFTVRDEREGAALHLAAARWGIARLGPVFTHVGFLLLVLGGLWMASTGFSGIVWLRPGDRCEIPGTDAHLYLDDFQIEMGPGGRIAEYTSSVRLMRDTTLVRAADIEVNQPLRYRGRSIYQSSYRHDPGAVRSLNIVFDAPVVPIESVPSRSSGEESPLPVAEAGRQPASPHGDPRNMPHTALSDPYLNPITLTLFPQERIQLPGTPYAVAIDTFLVDFLFAEGRPRLGSDQPRNPAARLAFFAGDSLIGRTWFFILHPEMPVGNGPDLRLRLASFDPVLATGLDIATHPGSGWVWAGIVVMSLGTLLSFMLRHERVWVRIATKPEPGGAGWEIAAVHIGGEPQDPARVREDWERAITPLLASMIDRWPATGGKPRRWPGSNPDN